MTDTISFDMIVRLSAKLSRKIKERSLSPAPPNASPYLDWHAHLFTHHRAQYIIVTNSTSLFSIFIHGAGITDFNRFFQTWMMALRDTMHDLDADMIYQKMIVSHTGAIRIVKQQDKRIIGSMNEQILFAKTILKSKDISPYDVAFEINENILSYLDFKQPVEVFLQMKETSNNG